MELGRSPLHEPDPRSGEMEHVDHLLHESCVLSFDGNALQVIVETEHVGTPRHVGVGAQAEGDLEKTGPVGLRRRRKQLMDAGRHPINVIVVQVIDLERGR